MLLAFEITTPSSHDALLDADLFNLGCGSVGCAFRTGTAPLGAP
jgi:hypothetical protein